MTTPKDEPEPNRDEYWLSELRNERQRHKEATQKLSGSYLGFIAFIVVIIIGVIMGNAESY